MGLVLEDSMPINRPASASLSLAWIHVLIPPVFILWGGGYCFNYFLRGKVEASAVILGGTWANPRGSNSGALCMPDTL